MKVKILLFIVVLGGAIALNVSAQMQPPNGGFENWSNKAINEPNGFFTSNAMSSADSGNVIKVTDSYHGLYAAKLKTILSGSDTVNGLLLIGTPGNQGINGGLPFTGTPDSISGYVKYNIQLHDTAFFIVAFKKNGTIIGQAVTTFTGIQSGYKRFSIATHLSTLTPPDSLVAVITSSKMDPPQIVGSTLTIDSISFLHSSQPFPNGDFENWTAVNTGQNPMSWSSFNNFYNYGIPIMSFKTTDKNSGTYALRIISDTAVVSPPFGTGVLDTMAGYVFLGGTDMNNLGIPYTDRPLAMQAFVKGTILAGSQAYVIATLRKWNTVTHVRDQVGQAGYSTGSSIANYLQISVPFTYSLAAIPDTLEISIMAGNVGPGGFIMPGNEFFVDDISFTFPTGINEANNDMPGITVFPNPASDKITVSSLEKINAIEIYNLIGEKVYVINNSNNAVGIPMGQTSIGIDLSGFQKGIYFVKMYGQENSQTKKIVIQ